MTSRLPGRFQSIIDPPATARTSQTSFTNAILGRGLTVARAAGALLYPPHCMACGIALDFEGNGVLCLECVESVEWVGADRCKRCGDRVGEGRGAVDRCPSCQSRPPVFVETTVTVARYGGPIRAVILGLKFGGGLQAAPFLGRLLGERIKEADMASAEMPSSVLVPVPLARKDFSSRGFNQAQEIAEAISGHTGIPVSSGLLVKKKPTPPQATLDRDSRRENLRGCFEVNREHVKKHAGKPAILVDDVMTTGATAGECARVLREAGLKEVQGAMVARG